jgi:hypothetical protein
MAKKTPPKKKAAKKSTVKKKAAKKSTASRLPKGYATLEIENPLQAWERGESIEATPIDKS